MAKDESVHPQMIKIWVDDEREMPEDYNIWEITVWDTIDLLETCYRHWISVKLSLDHDAGVHAANCGDYIKILDWLEKKSNESESWKQFIENKMTFHLHTANPVGRENMRRIIQKNGWREGVEIKKIDELLKEYENDN